MPGKSVLVLWVNVQQIIMTLGFVAANLAHTMPRIVAEFELLIMGCFPPFYQSVFGCKTFFPQAEFCVLLCTYLFPWSELVWSGIGSELA